MIIKQSSLDPIIEKLITSNNQQEKRLDLISKMILDVKSDVQKIKDDNQRKRSMEF